MMGLKRNFYYKINNIIIEKLLDLGKCKVVKDYSKYIIFKNSKVFSFSSLKFMKPCLQTNTKTNYKRYIVDLTKNNKKKHFSIHRLLALHFIDNPHNLPEVDHININSLDNRLENLRWASRALQGLNKHIQSNNTSGIKGVRYVKKENSYRARWHVNKKECSRTFSVKKYGDKAFELSADYRKEMEIKHYSNII